MEKIAIIGAGRVGESTAQFLAKNDTCRELVLLDVREGAAEGAALDIQETAPLFGFDTRLKGGTDAAILSGAELVVIPEYAAMELTSALPAAAGASEGTAGAVPPAVSASGAPAGPAGGAAAAVPSGGASAPAASPSGFPRTGSRSMS